MAEYDCTRTRANVVLCLRGGRFVVELLTAGTLCASMRFRRRPARILAALDGRQPSDALTLLRSRSGN